VRGRVRALFWRLVRSAGAGAVATVVDLGALTILVSFVGVSPRVANVPALVLGATVMFFGQKHVAFRAKGGSVTREAILFALVQLGGLALNALLYDLVLRAVPGAARFYVPVRMGTTNVVWLAYSFPMWHLVFAPRRKITSSVPPPPPSSP
jgi:putative flippase GtrA